MTLKLHVTRYLERSFVYQRHRKRNADSFSHCLYRTQPSSGTFPPVPKYSVQFKQVRVIDSDTDHLLTFTVTFSKTRREQDLSETLTHIHPHTPQIKAIAEVPLFKIYF